MLQLTAVGKGLSMGTTEGYCDKGNVAPRTNMSDGWRLDTICIPQSQMQGRKRKTQFINENLHA
jgi:hypothetical protein